MHAANDLSMLMHLDGYYSNDLAYKHSRSYLLKVDHGADELEINGRTGLFFKGIKKLLILFFFIFSLVISGFFFGIIKSAEVDV